MTKIAFIGTALPDEIEQKSGQISAAGNRYQNNLVTSLRNAGLPVKTLSFVHLADPMLAKELPASGEEASYVVLGGRRTAARVITYLQFQKQLRALIRESDVVISYNVVYTWFRLPALAKRYHKKSIVFLADYSGPECFNNPVRKLYAKLMLYVMRKYQCVVGLSPGIRKYLKKTQSFCLMEGGISRELYDSLASEDALMQQWLQLPWRGQRMKTVMYAGLLNEVTGVDLLLQAMEKCPVQNMELWISGKGPLKEQVKQAADRDSRIRFLGHLPYLSYIECLKKADILVNPRNMNLPENGNNFPSKMMDYLAAGKPILSTAFPGAENFKSCVTFCSSDEKAIAAGMEQLIGKLEQLDKAEIYADNRVFAGQYLWENQLKKIL